MFCDNPGGASFLPEDCDDTNADVSPLEVEVYYDGVDQDCGNDDDFDADLDGYADPSGGGNDCDDADEDNIQNNRMCVIPTSMKIHGLVTPVLA